MKKTALICILLCICSFLQFSAFAEDNNLLVEFSYRGKEISVQGEKIGPGEYLFNKGAKKKIWITTLDWKPYIGQTLCKQGWVQQLAIALFASRGYEVKSTFYPWARTIRVAENGQADILYPEWYIESSAPSDVNPGKMRRDNLAISERFPGGPIAFMKRKGEPDLFNGDLTSLKNEKIAVVRGYQNTPAFDKLMDQGFFSIHQTDDDLMQAKVLLGKRVNLLINDPLVVRFTVDNSDLPRVQKTEMANSLEVVKPLIKYNYLYFAVSKKKPRWRQTLDMVNQAVQEFEATGLMFHIMKETAMTCQLDLCETLSPYRNAQCQNTSP